MSVQVKRGEFQLDPRLLANQQKILQCLKSIKEDQHSLRQDIRMIKEESKHFQRDVYKNFQHISSDLTNIAGSLDDLFSNTDTINSRVKTVYKHVKLYNTRQEKQSVRSDTGSSARLQRSHNRAAARTEIGLTDGYLQPLENDFESPDTGDSDIDFSQPLKVKLPNEDYHSRDPNLLPSSRSTRNPTGGTRRGDSRQREVYQQDSHSSQSGRINTLPQINIQSPVQLQDTPPDNVHKPGTKVGVVGQQRKSNRSRSRNPTPHLPIHGLTQCPLPGPPLLKKNCNQIECLDLSRQWKIELASGNVEAIRLGSQSRGTQHLQTGLHTVFILDTSESMAGNPFESAKVFLNHVLENLDASAGQFGLEEYVSIITFGLKTNIFQPFTNDYMNLKRRLTADLENLQVTGKSPLQQSFAAALAYIECNGAGVMLHDHQILPRVVIISDFAVTNEHNPDLEDVAGSNERTQAQQKVYSFMSLFKRKQYYTFCVPVGNYNQSVCAKIAQLGNGTVIMPETPEKVSFYYIYQIIIANCINQYNDKQEEGQEEDVENLVVQALQRADMSIEDKDTVLALIDVALASEGGMDDLQEAEIENDVGAVGGEFTPPPPSAYQQRVSTASPMQPQSDISSFESSQPESVATGDSQSVDYLPEWRVPKWTTNLSLEEIGRLPPLGSRVQRGKDWTWGSKDNNGPGTVVGHKMEGIVFVIWDKNSEPGSYRFAYQGDKYDIEVIKAPRSVDYGHIEIGCLVSRGSDWSKGDEDGGEGTFGVVVRKLPDRNVQVRWPSRVVETYKFGADDIWEVQVVTGETMSAVASRAQTPESYTSNTSRGSGERPAVLGEEETQAVWRWQDSSNQWRIMSPASIDKIETTFKSNPNSKVMVQYKGKNTKVFLESMECEINGRKCPIQREIMNLADIENLQGLEELMGD